MAVPAAEVTAGKNMLPHAGRKTRLHLLAAVFFVQLLQDAAPPICRGDTSLVLTMPPILAAAQSQAQSTWWQPKPGTSWQWQLSGTIDTSLQVMMYDIDYETPTAIIEELHARGKTVVCYLSAGSWEDYRPDAYLYPAGILGNSLYGWPDERWVDIRRLDILGPILQARMDNAAEKGCDGIEPDNVDGYQNNSGFPLTHADQIAFNTWLAREAHDRKLSIGLKNDLGQAAELEPFFDWALNEECFQYNECAPLLAFVNAGKAVFGVEYAGDPAGFCPAANSLNFDWLKKNRELDAWRLSCR